MTGPRIYNLFPLLAGPVPAWKGHLDRVAAMGFDWLYVNPFHYPGFSGSLYAVKDFYRLHPLLADGGDPQRLLSGFTKAAARRERNFVPLSPLHVRLFGECGFKSAVAIGVADDAIRRRKVHRVALQHAHSVHAARRRKC